MSRGYAPIFVEIWQDKAFTSLSVEAQRLYLLVNSQPDITYCGVVAYNERRWAKWASNTNGNAIFDALKELHDSGFVLFDEDTDEVWVRSFVKHNNVLKQPNVLKAARSKMSVVHSDEIRDLVRFQLYPNDASDDQQNPLAETPSEPQANPSAYPSLTHTGTPGLNDQNKPEPKPETKPKPSSSSRALKLVQDDEGRFWKSVWSLVARSDYANRPPDAKRVFNYQGWIASAERNAESALGDVAAKFRSEHPTAQVDDVVLFLLEQDSLNEEPQNPDLYRYCERCDEHNGFIEDSSGDMRRCGHEALIA